MQHVTLRAGSDIFDAAAGRGDGAPADRPAAPPPDGPLPEPARVSGAGIHMPNPSHWPFACAVGILVFFVGFMFPLATTAQLVLSIGGGLLTAFAIFRWAFEPAG